MSHLSYVYRYVCIGPLSYVAPLLCHSSRMSIHTTALTLVTAYHRSYVNSYPITPSFMSELTHVSAITWMSCLT